jgi:hypothetical protein
VREFLGQSRESIVARLQSPLDVLDATLVYLKKLREQV